MISLAVILQLLGAAPPARSTAELSETELASRYPFLGALFAVLFLAGLVVDAWLLLHWRQHYRAGQGVLRVEGKPWNGLEVVLAVLAFLAGSFVLGLVSLAVFGKPDLGRPSTLLLELVLRSGWLLLIAEFLRRRTNWRAAFGIQADSQSAAAKGALLYVGLLPLFILFSALYERLLRACGVAITAQPITGLFLHGTSPVTIGLLVFFALVAAPVFEEVLFRGLAYPAIKQRFGIIAALVVVNLGFAAMHGHGPTAGPLFVLGIGLALAYEYTGSLLTPITLHALFNATNVFMLLYVRANS